MKYVYAILLLLSLLIAFGLNAWGQGAQSVGDVFSAETIIGTLIFAALIFVILALSAHLAHFIYHMKKVKKVEK